MSIPTTIEAHHLVKAIQRIELNGVPKRRAHRIGQRRIRMTQPMPAHAHQTELLAGRLKLFVDQIVPLKRGARRSEAARATGKDLLDRE